MPNQDLFAAAQPAPLAAPRAGGAAVAVLGAGIMGSAIARRLAAAGFEVRVWNRSPGRAEALGDVARPCPGIASAVSGSAYVITMLSDAAAIEEAVLADPHALAGARGAIWVQTSTVGADASKRFAGAAASRGLRFVDAPVIGTRGPAERGTLTVLASGRAEDLAACRPVFEAIATRALAVGEGATASRMKVLVNAWVLGLVTALAECIAIAQELDLDPSAFIDAVKGTAVDAPFVSLKGSAMVEGDFRPDFPLRLAAKDAALLLDACGTGRFPLADAVAQQLARAAALGHGDEDVAAVVAAMPSGGPTAS